MFSALQLTVAAIAGWLTIGVLGMLPVRRASRIIGPLFVAGAAVGLALAIVAIIALGQTAQSTVLPLGLPDLPFHLRLDSLSAFFLVLLGATASGISLFSAGYFRDQRRQRAWLAVPAVSRVPRGDGAGAARRRRLRLHGRVGNDGALLVLPGHDRSSIAEIRRAGFLYLLIAHIGAIAILLCFGVLQGGSGDYTFGSMRSLRASGRVGSDRLLAGAVRIRRQGRAAAAARLAARSASGRALAGVGADERRDAQDRDLRPAARHASTCSTRSCGGGA